MWEYFLSFLGPILKSKLFIRFLDFAFGWYTALREWKKKGKYIEKSRNSSKHLRRPATFYDPGGHMLTQLYEGFWQKSGNQQIQPTPQSIKGMGGVGKTTLTCVYAHDFQSKYKGVWWLEAQSEASIVSGLAALAHELASSSVKNISAEQRAKAALNAISQHKSEKPYLLVYDNVDDKALLREWLPSGGAHILLTSQQGNWGDIANEFTLDVWETHIGADYLETRFKKSNTATPPRPELERLTTELGGLPLALDHAASHLIDQAFVSVQDYLKDLEKYLQACPEADSYERSVSATFQIALKALEEKEGGKDALEFLNLIAHLGPHGIGKDQLKSLATFQGLKFEHLPLATQYALLQRSGTDAGEVLYMHRILALVIHGLQGETTPKYRDKVLLWLKFELENKNL